MELGKYSFGLGDRFSLQGEAQLQALIRAKEQVVDIHPVWNKSNREHMTIGSEPWQTREEADMAVERLAWKDPYFVDADHINLGNVSRFIEHSNFFTIDVADYIGKLADPIDIEAFIRSNQHLAGQLMIPGIDEVFHITESDLYRIACKFLYAIQQASVIYAHIALKKQDTPFVTEISMDEVNEAQSPVELFFILSALAAEKIPVNTIAPKFTGRFNKGVDYEGDVQLFSKEFEQDILVIDYAIKRFGLPAGLKLSVHSGSDKFSIYPAMGTLIRKYDKGIHVKTAGTTWLEEVIGLSLSGGEALKMIKEFYAGALSRYEELTSPYATVIDIDKNKLPSPRELDQWDGERLASALRHIPGHPHYNPDFRQLMHVGYKLAAEAGERYLSLLKQNKEIVGRQVTENIFDRHLCRLFELKNERPTLSK